MCFLYVEFQASRVIFKWLEHRPKISVNLKYLYFVSCELKNNRSILVGIVAIFACDHKDQIIVFENLKEYKFNLRVKYNMHCKP